MEFAVAIVGGLVGGLVAYLMQMHLTMYSADTSSLNEHIDELRIIEDYAVAYWLLDHDEDLRVESDLEAKLEGALTASACFNEDAKRILGRLYPAYVEFDQEFFDAVTGGDFQTAHRKSEPHRVIEIIRIGNEMRALLRKGRRQQYGAK